jgi:predicted NACHT family NTPase
MMDNSYTLLITSNLKPPNSFFENQRHIQRYLFRLLGLAYSSELGELILRLKKQLPPPTLNNQECYRKWRDNGKIWIEELRQAMITHRNIGHDWQFTEEQKQKLRLYYDANQLLVDCLNSECYVSRAVREEIESMLLLPVEALTPSPSPKLGEGSKS